MREPLGSAAGLVTAIADIVVSGNPLTLRRGNRTAARRAALWCVPCGDFIDFHDEGVWS
jgi:hypothetical protein